MGERQWHLLLELLSTDCGENCLLSMQPASPARMRSYIIIITSREPRETRGGGGGGGGGAGESAAATAQHTRELWPTFLSLTENNKNKGIA